jgi:hypothetical protein
MTLVGHSLTGVAIGIVCLPKSTSREWKMIYFTILMALANLPDFPFRYWGHDRYDISHSLFVNLFGILVIFPWGLFPSVRSFIIRLPVLWAGAFAWLSHLLLDSFYNHGHGIAIYWPVSRARLVFPIPWFSVLPNTPPPFTLRHFQIYGVELLAYGALVGFIMLIRHLLQAPQTLETR